MEAPPSGGRPPAVAALARMSERRLAAFMVSPSLSADRARRGVSDRLRGLAVAARVQRPGRRASRAGPACATTRTCSSDSGLLGVRSTTRSSSPASRCSRAAARARAWRSAMHSAFRGQGAAAHGRARAVGGAHGRHGDHVADDLRVRTIGFVNSAARDRHACGSAPSPQAMIVMIIADVWKTAPFMALLLLAGLQVIPDGDLRGGQGRRRDHVAAVQQASRCRCSCPRSWSR